MSQDRHGIPSYTYGYGCLVYTHTIIMAYRYDCEVAALAVITQLRTGFLGQRQSLAILDNPQNNCKTLT